MGCKKQIFGTRNPSYFRYGCIIDYPLVILLVAYSAKLDGSNPYIFVETCISLGNGLPPNDFASRETHNDIDMRYALCHHVDIVA